MRTRIEGGQEQLFAIIPQDGTIFVPEAEPEYGDAAVSLVDRNIHLLSTLAIFGELNQYAGLEKGVRSKQHLERIKAPYGIHIEQVTEGAQRNREIARKQAKWHFARAASMFEMIDSGADVTDTRSRMARFFTRFQLRFDGPRNTPERNSYQDTLLDNIRLMQQKVSEDNRAQGLRPHQKRRKSAPKDALPAPVEQVLRDKPLGTRERLLPIADDIRAGFFPTTHREKNKVLDILDYRDNPKYPLGTNNQQFEIYNRQARLQKEKGEELDGGPERAAESLAYELVDYLNDAVESLGRLRWLHDLMLQNPDDFLNPRLVPAIHFNDGSEDFNKLMEALHPLRRYLDIQEYSYGQTELTVFADPLITREDRWAKTGPGKHKKVHDRYMQQDNQHQADMLFRGLTELDIQIIRTTLPAAILDSTKRVMFHAQGAQELFRLEQGPFKPARDLAISALQGISVEYLPDAAA